MKDQEKYQILLDDGSLTIVFLYVYIFGLPRPRANKGGLT